MRYATLDAATVITNFIVADAAFAESIGAVEMHPGWQIGGTLVDGVYTAPPAPDPVIPQAVTMRQARLALLGAGLLPQVNAAIAAIPSPQKEAAQIEWEYAQEVQRHSGLVPQLATALGLSEVQIDALFTTAAGL